VLEETVEDQNTAKPVVFTPEEIETYRADINAMRRPGAYVAGQWSVSPLNRDPAVVGPLPASVRLRDVTMRSLETLPGVVLDPVRKRDFLGSLVRSGVPEIVTAPVRSRAAADVAADIELIKSINPGCRTTCPMVFTRDDLVAPVATGYDSVQVWVPPWGTASAIYEGRALQAGWDGKDWRELGIPASREGFLRRAVELVEAGREAGLRVSVPVLMVSFLDDERLEQTVEALSRAGANEIALFDGPGAMGPEAMAHLVTRTKQIAPEVEIGLHPHNSFGMAVSVALSAVRAGADVVEVSVNGYCGGPGNADLAVAVAAFEAMYGISTGVDHSMLVGLARAAEQMTGYQRAYNHPVTGERVYNWGGMDFMTQENAVDSLLHNCIAPAWAGAQPPLPVTEASGPFTVWDKMLELGFVPTRSGVDDVLRRVRQFVGTQGRLAGHDDLIRFAGEAGLRRTRD
jgi:hypothetical protein